MGKLGWARVCGCILFSGLMGCGSGGPEATPPPDDDAAESAGETAEELIAAPGTTLTSVITSGGLHSCVVLEGGSVLCWGANDRGQLGASDTRDRGRRPYDPAHKLVQVPLGRGVTAKAVSAGGGHTCALLNTTNQVKCWGVNSAGQLGMGDQLDRGANPGEMGDNLPTVDLGYGRTAKAVAAGGSFTCALLDTNQVKCWGSNVDGELGLGRAGLNLGTSDYYYGDKPGEMGDSLPPVNLGVGRSATAIAAGNSFACALLDTKEVKCWGYNGSGSLGQGNTTGVGETQSSMANLQPINLGAGSKVAAIAANGNTACALIETVNQVKCWGYNNDGALGYGDRNNRGDGTGEMGDTLPYVSLGGGALAKAVTVGGQHVCVQLDVPNPPPTGPVNTNQVKCWGDSHFGQLGEGSTLTRGDGAGEMGDSRPLIDLGPGRSIRAMAAGARQTCAILDTNQVKCWGANERGQSGISDTILAADGKAVDTTNMGDQPNEMGNFLPLVPLGSRAATFAVMGNQFGCARLLSGELKCWGRNDRGQLGQGDMTNRGRSPMGSSLPAVALGTNRTVYSGAGVIATGDAHTCVVLDNKQVKCWGLSLFGALGRGNTDTIGDGPGEMGDMLPNVNLGAGKLALQVTAGRFFSCARLSTNQVKCWGENSKGQLGIGTADARGDGTNEMGDTLPVVNLGTSKTASYVGAGINFACALITGGEVKCWGDNAGGVVSTTPLGDGASEMGDLLAPVPLGTGLTAKSIAVGGMHACALLNTNQIKCWGDNSAGQLGQGDTTARRSAATLGDNQPVINLGVGRTAKAVYASYQSTCALLDNNQLKCWGSNDRGQLGLNDILNRGDQSGELGDLLPTIQLGSSRTVLTAFVGSSAQSHCASLDNRLIKCWGANTSGELGTGSTIPSAGADPSINTMGDNLLAVDLGSEL